MLPKPIDLAGCKTSTSGVWQNDSQFNADKVVDGRYNTRWQSAEAVKSYWVEIDLGEAKRFSKTSIWEGWDLIQKFELLAKEKSNDKWRTIHEGTTLGSDYWVSFKPVTARYIRLNIIESLKPPTIWEIDLFE